MLRNVTILVIHFDLSLYMLTIEIFLKSWPIKFNLLFDKWSL